MKQTLLLLLLAMPILLKAQAKEMKFKVQIIPETTYNQSTTQSSHTEVNYSASEEFLQRLKDKGVDNPTVTDNVLTIKSEYKALKLTDKTHFPVRITLHDIESANGKQILPNGTVIYGNGTLGKIPVLDSVSGEGMDDAFKKSFLEMMQKMMSQLQLPEQTVKVGGTFSNGVPLSIPVGKNNLDMTITTTYKLLDISNGIANFDLVQSYSMDTDIAGQDFKATGSGTGKLRYDTKYNFYLYYETDSKMTIHGVMPGFEMNSTVKSNIIQETKITADGSSNPKPKRH